MKNLLSLLTISFFCQQLYAQIVCSAPYSAEEISSSRNAIWVLGQSDEKGRGVFKLENGTWFFYDQPQAINLSATNNNEPLVINNNKELFIFRGTWQQIGSNISKVIGSKNSGNIWAIRDNNLKFYRNNNWYDSSYDAMYISDIAEDQSGNLYALNNTGYVFKAVGSAWQIMGNKKGEAINAGYQGEILLISNEMQNNGNNVYINTNGSWSLYPEQAKKISAGLNQVVYFIDNLGVLYSMRGGVKKKITIDKIVTGGVGQPGTGQAQNFNYNPDVNAIDTINGETSLFQAVRNNDLSSIYTMLSKKADINKRNNKGETPLLVATQLNHPEISRALINLKADVNAIDNRRGSALVYSCKAGDTKTAQLLLANGANAKQGNPLDFAVNINRDDENKVALINDLLKGGCVPNFEHMKKVVALDDFPTFTTLKIQPGLQNIQPNQYTELMNQAMINKNIDIVSECILKGADSNKGMLFAAKENNKPLMLTCLEKGANPNPAVDFCIRNNDMDFFTICLSDKYKGSRDNALKQCVKAQNIAFINKALELGANSNAGLPEAIASKNVEIMEILFNKGADGSTPSLMVDAVNTSDINIVKLMLSHGGDANNGTLRAVQIGHVEILNHLLTSGNGSNPELIATASSMGNNEIITILLNKGADANNGLLPAVNQNKIETVKLLLQNGANAKTKDILIEPSKKGQLELVQLLVENGANATEGLMSAVQNNKPKVLEYLIDNKADISNKLLIIGAVNSNYTAIVDVLIRKGADLTVKDDQSNNLLHLSAAKYSLEVSRQLINSGKVDINAINNNNHTPLMVVAINSKGKSEHLCQLMVTNGADVNARDGNFETIYQIAKGRKVKKYLKSVGAPKK